MAVDPNVYALSIQLQFDAAEAFTTLDDFGQQVNDLEEKVSTAAQKAIQSLSSISAEAQSALVDLAKQFDKIDANTLKIQTNLSDATKELKDQFDNGEEQLKNSKKEFEIAEDMDELREKFTKEMKLHVDLQQDFLSILQKVIKSVIEKNKGHSAQNGFLRTDKDLATAINQVLDQQKKKVKDNKDEVEKLSISWYTVWGWIKKADEDTEKFTTTNFRHYGSQQQLVQGARELAMANAIAYDKAVEAYAVMGNLKVPREELDRYAKAVGQANRTTGVGIQTTGDYVNRLRVAGMSLQGTERNLSKMGEAMRKFGLNTRDVNALMNVSAANVKNAARVFGLAGDELSKWEDSRKVLAGFAREAGHGAEELAGFENWILNDVAALEQFKGMANTTEAGLDGFKLAMVRAGIAADKQMAQIEEGVKNGTRSQTELLAIQNSLVEIQFGGNRAAFEAARAQGKLAQKYGMTGANIEEVNRLTEIYTGTLNDQMSEANNTFTAQLRILWTTIVGAGRSIMQFVADALLPLLKALNWVIWAFGKLVGWIADGIRWLEKIPVLGKVVTFLKWAVGIVLALGLAFVVLSGAVISFSAILGGFAGLLGRMTAGVTAFANLILILVRAVGQGIIIILSSLGTGLQMLGNSVRGVMMPLLVLGVALMLAGIGAYFLAMGVRIIAEVGWAAVPAILGLTVAIALLGVVLVVLAGFLAPVVAVLIPLALVILAVGVASFLMGVGFYFAGMGLQMMAGVISFGLIAKLVLLGVAIVALAAIAVAAAPATMSLAAGLVIVAVAAILMAVAFYIVVEAIKQIGVDLFPALASSIMSGSVMLLAAAAMLMVGAVLLLAGAAILTVAVGYMIVLIPELVIIGAGLVASGSGFVVGSAMLMVAGVMLLIAGIGILIGGLGVFLGLKLLAISTPLMMGIGFGLLIGSTMMKAGTIGLLTTGALLLIAGIAMFVGALLLLEAAKIMIQTVPMFAQAGVGYIAAAAEILTGSVMLAAAGIFMVAAGVLLSVGGVSLIVAGIMLAIGLAFLSDSSQEMLGIGVRIGIGGMMMLAGAQALVAASALLGDSADQIDKSLSILKNMMARVVEAVAAMLPAGMMLRLVGLQLVIGAAYIQMASDALQTGAPSLLVGAILLQSAGAALLLGASNVLEAVESLQLAGTTIVASGEELVKGAGVIRMAAIEMMDAAILLMSAGSLMKPAARAIYTGLLWVEFAVYRFSKTIDNVEKVGAAMSLLSNSFMTLHKTPKAGLREMSEETLGAIPNIEKLGSSLIVAAKKLDEGVTAFEGPAERLNSILTKLTETITAFGQGLNLTDDVGRMAEMLNNYAGLLENASVRIEAAVASKAIPAMRAAEQAGIEETVRSEAINTVQVIDQTEGGANDAQDENTRELIKLNETMTAVKDMVSTMGVGGRGELSEIVAILQAYLPGMNKGDAGLGSEFNSWAR